MHKDWVFRDAEAQGNAVGVGSIQLLLPGLVSDDVVLKALSSNNQQQASECMINISATLLCGSLDGLEAFEARLDAEKAVLLGGRPKTMEDTDEHEEPPSDILAS